MKYSEISEKQEQTAQWLYHATSLHNLKKIAKTGLRAGTKKRANFAGYDDHIPGKIFFSTSLSASKKWMDYIQGVLIQKVNDKDLWGIIDPAYITIVMTRTPFRKVEKDDRGDGDVRGSVYSSTKVISPNLIQFWNPDKNAWMPITGGNLENITANAGRHEPEELTEATDWIGVVTATSHGEEIEIAVNPTYKDAIEIARYDLPFHRVRVMEVDGVIYAFGGSNATHSGVHESLFGKLKQPAKVDRFTIEDGVLYRIPDDNFSHMEKVSNEVKNRWFRNTAPPLTESVKSDIQVPLFFYRGSEMATRSAFLTKIWRRPDPALPDNLNDLLEQGLTTHVYGLSYNLPFKISRTYSGMSNWGFGVYFASTVQWAMRYGENITCVTISPNEILAIRADDFAQEIEGTVGAAFRKKLVAKAGDSMRDQAPVIASVVRSMKRGAKALYVETSPGEGQICVFGKSAIYPKFYFEMKKTGEEE